MKIQVILIILFCCSICYAQKKLVVIDEHRLPGQKYFEDSTHVYWNHYPNPMAPPTVSDTGKGRICGDIVFYCDKSDSVDIAFVTMKDSIVYQLTIPSWSKHVYSLCYWKAGPNVQVQSLPQNHYQALANERLGLLLIIDGRKMALKEGALSVRKGWYYWIDDRNVLNTQK